jgi:hypothetical protein
MQGVPCFTDTPFQIPMIGTLCVEKEMVVMLVVTHHVSHIHGSRCL